MESMQDSGSHEAIPDILGIGAMDIREVAVIP